MVEDAEWCLPAADFLPDAQFQASGDASSVEVPTFQELDLGRMSVSCLQQ